jgi:hypothetical protein
VTNEQKIWRILQALDDRRTGLLDPAGLVDTLLVILAGQDPYLGQDVDLHTAWEPAP